MYHGFVITWIILSTKHYKQIYLTKKKNAVHKPVIQILVSNTIHISTLAQQNQPLDSTSTTKFPIYRFQQRSIFLIFFFSLPVTWISQRRIVDSICPSSPFNYPLKQTRFRGYHFFSELSYNNAGIAPVASEQLASPASRQRITAICWDTVLSTGDYYYL